MYLLLASLVSLVTSVSGHAIFQELYVNGVSQGHLNGIRVPDYDGPIMDVTSNDIICNGGINPYHQPMSTTVIKAAAGAQLTAEWHHDLNGANPSDIADPIDPSHHGPVLVYMAQIPSATQSSVTGLKWFKIYHDGLTGTTWGVDKMYAAKGKINFTVPSCIPAGQYLLRVEVIALHAAQSYPGSQFYMECAQMQITGGGSTQPATVSFPGAYKGTDPGITVNIYFPVLTNYTIPGPSVFTCAGGGSAPPSSTAPPATTSAPATTTSRTTSAPATTSTNTSGGTAAHFAQCGGIGYTGPTVCAAPYTCVVSNEFYSQCL